MKWGRKKKNEIEKALGEKKKKLLNKRLKERMRVFFCIFQKVQRNWGNTERCKMEENRTEPTLCWVKGISAAVAAKSRALIYTKKSKFLTQTIPTHIPQSPCDFPWEQDKAKATAWHTRLSLAFSSGDLHAQHIISKGSFEHRDDTILLSVIPSRL